MIFNETIISLKVIKNKIKIVFYFFIIMSITPFLSFLSIKIIKKNDFLKISESKLKKSDNELNENELKKENDVIIEENNLIDNNLSNNINIFDKSLNKKYNISREEFLIGVVSAEMPVSFHEEALKAQIVAANTFYIYKINEDSFMNKDKIFEVNGSKTFSYNSKEKMKELWKYNFDENYKKINELVNSTKNEIIYDYENNPILALFHRMSPGFTNKCSDIFNKDFYYLVPVDSSHDALIPGFKNTFEIDLKTFKKKLNKKLIPVNKTSNLCEKEKWIEIINKNKNNAVKNLKIFGKEVKGSELRNLFGFQSQNFKINCDYKLEKITFTVYGNGHGVGMSQEGSNFLAKKGYDYKKILSHYYPGTFIKNFKN